MQFKKYFLIYILVTELVCGLQAKSEWDTLYNESVRSYQRGNYTKSSELALAALKVARQNYDSQSSELSDSLNELALNYTALRHYLEAKPLYVRALDINRKLYGKKSSEVATILNNLGGLYIAWGKYDSSLEKYKDALNIRRKILGYEHTEVASVYLAIGNLYYSSENYKSAIKNFENTMEIFKILDVPYNIDYAVLGDKLADSYEMTGKSKKADEVRSRAAKIRDNLKDK